MIDVEMVSLDASTVHPAHPCFYWPELGEPIFARVIALASAERSVIVLDGALAEVEHHTVLQLNRPVLLANLSPVGGTC